MVKKYVKKPVVVEAIQWKGDNFKEVKEITKDSPTERAIMIHPHNDDCLLIVTLEGEMRADKGDYIIKVVEGEFYPCKPDIFDKSYEAVEQ